MTAVLVLPLAAAVYAGAIDVGARASIREEARGGYTGDGPTVGPSLDSELTPSLTLAGHDAELLGFDATYSPSFLSKTRDPSATPFVLHELAASFVDGDRKGDAFRLHLSAMSGPLDYNRAAAELATDGKLAAFPLGGIVSYANADVMGSYYHVLTRRLATETDLFAGYTGPSVTNATTDIILRQYRAGLEQRLDWLATRRTTLSADVTLTGVAFEAGSQYLGLTPGVGWRYRLTHETAVSARAGLQLTRTYPAAGAAGGTSAVDSAQPVGNVTITSQVPFSRRTALTLEARGELSPFYDAFTGIQVQRAVGTFSAGIVEKRGPSVHLDVQWYEPLSSTGGGAVFDLRDERLAAVGLTVAAPISRWLGVQIGAVTLKHWAPGAPLMGFGGAPEVLGFASLTGQVDFGSLEAPAPQPPKHHANP